MHSVRKPAILYFGTPVVLVSTLNEDGSANLGPMSSIFWLGWRCMIGLASVSKTTSNILRTGECVLNLPSEDMVEAVNRLALTTGTDPVPEGKKRRGYVHCADKFNRAGLTQQTSKLVAAPSVAECPVQLEARLEATHQMAQRDWPGGAMCFELRIVLTRLCDAIMRDDEPDHVDPDLWRPLIMSFQRFYGLGPQREPSVLAEVRERLYLTPDHARAHNSTGQAAREASALLQSGA